MVCSRAFSLHVKIKRTGREPSAYNTIPMSEILSVVFRFEHLHGSSSHCDHCIGCDGRRVFGTRRDYYHGLEGMILSGAFAAVLGSF